MAAAKNGAVGLSAQQCEINVCMVYFNFKNGGRFLFNPHIIQRLSERQMRVGTKHCLVLPPWIDITALRDVIVLIFQCKKLKKKKKKSKIFIGEPALALQHKKC